MRVALTGGGTGGHIYPCLAVAEILKENNAELFYIGGKGKLEEKLITKRNPEIKFLPMKCSSLPRLKNFYMLPFWAIEFWLATKKCEQYIKENKIEVIFGTGGYAAGPAFAAAKNLKIPYILHNLDASIGLANKVFLKGAKFVTLALPTKSIKENNGRVKITGNPVSKEFFIKKYDADPVRNNQFASFANKKDFNILITGGSQGSLNLNNAVGEIIPELIKNPHTRIVHMTGEKLYQDHVNKFLDGDAEKHASYTVLPYTHEMPKLCALADIAICRSGAMTIAEMAASDTVPIFIPLPWAANDHQNKNAKSLAEAGAAIVIKEENLSSEKLMAEINDLMLDTDKFEQMKTDLRDFAHPTAARELANLVLNV